MNSLSEKIEEAWWKLDTNTALGLKLMPTPKEHKNLIGGKQKYLDAAIEAVKAHVAQCMAECPSLESREKYLMESLEKEKGG